MTEETTQAPESSITEMSYEDFTANFDTLLAQANGEEAPAPEESEESEEAVEEIEEEALESESDDADDAEEEVKTEETKAEQAAIDKSVKYFKDQAKRYEQEKLVVEQRYNELLSAIEHMAGGEQPAAKSEFEPLDEDAHKVYTQKMAELEAKQREIEMQSIHQQFTSALTTHEAAAKVEHPDFDNAFSHYKSVEIAKLEAMGIPKEIAADEVKQALAQTAFVAWQQGKDLGKMFYGMAKSVGYKPNGTAPKQKDVNHEAIARNRARTEKKPVQEVNPVGKTGNITERLQSMMVNGRVDPNQFQKLLKEYRN
jgi:hypothetical protein